MLDVGELYVLNRALDGKAIPGVEGLYEVEKSQAKTFMVDMIKEHLIDRGILATANTFTIEGLKETKKLKLYKQAKKYVTFQGITVGVINEEQGVVLVRNKENQYGLRMVHIPTWLSEIAELYSNWSNDMEEGKELQSMSRQEAGRIYYQEARMGFFIQVDSKDEHEKELYYATDTGNYIYDWSRGILEQVSAEKIRERVCRCFLLKEE